MATILFFSLTMKNPDFLIRIKKKFNECTIIFIIFINKEEI